MTDRIKVEKLEDMEYEGLTGLVEIKDSKLLGHLPSAQ